MENDINEHIEFVSAAAAVFAWVSAADGVITKYEVEAFVDYLCELEYTEEITTADFNETYFSLLEAFENDYEDGLSRVKARIESFKGDKSRANDLLKAARKALVADNNYSDIEELVVVEIANLLGIDESKIN